MSNVYMIQCMDYVKIGMSSNIKARIDALQCANPFKLILLDYIYCGSTKAANWMESKFHDDLEEYRINKKHEWFRIDPNLYDYFEAAKRSYKKETVDRWRVDYESILEARTLAENRSGFVLSAKTDHAISKFPMGLKCWETKAFYPPEDGAADYFTEYAINFKEATCRL